MAHALNSQWQQHAGNVIKRMRHAMKQGNLAMQNENNEHYDNLELGSVKPTTNNTRAGHDESLKIRKILH